MKTIILILVSLVSFGFLTTVHAQKQQLITKMIILNGTDDSFLKDQTFVEKVDPSVFKKMIAENSNNYIFADTIVFSYDQLSWEIGILVKVHSDKTSLPLTFSIGHVGSSFESLLWKLKQNFSYLKDTMKKQEMAAATGNKDYQYVN